MTPEAKKLLAPAFNHQTVTLSDSEVDQLISSGDSDACFQAFLVCKFSEQAGWKLKKAAYALMKKKPPTE